MFPVLGWALRSTSCAGVWNISKLLAKGEIIRAERKDARDEDPQNTHRRVFLGGWTNAVNGQLYDTVLKKKTHANMGNLFGWIYGHQSMDFKLETWYRYRAHALKRQEDA